MELRSRSRSKTPFQTGSFIEGEVFGSNHVSVTRTTRRSVRTTTTSGSETFKGRTRALHKTSDYSSEEGELDAFGHISENEKNQILEDAIAAANGTKEISALNLYRKAGRYWDKYPKTDYTYSRHSRDRVELAPGVVQMPNMSRRTIHSDSSTNTTESYLATKSQQLRQRLFSSPNNNDETDDVSFKIMRASAASRRTVVSTLLSVVVSVYTFVSWCIYSVYETSNSTMIYFGKQLHHLASRVMLLDTWLLRKSSGGEQRKTKAIVALCLVPLLIFAAWFLLSSLGSAIYWSLFNPSTAQAPLTPITEELHFVPPPPPIETPPQSDEKLLQLVADLQTEISKIKQSMSLLQQSSADDLTRLRAENVRNLAVLTRKMSRCCGKQTIDLEPHITKMFTALLNDPAYLTNQEGLTEWLSSMFVARRHLDARLTEISADFKLSAESTANQVMDKVVTRLSARPLDAGPISDEQIRKVVQSALRIYDADRTGLVDYAMEPLGGEIVTTRCTESYHSGTAVISVLGVPVWYPSISPRVVISPGINPGECWAFQNFPGFLVIRLAGRVTVEALSVEHVSRLLVPEGKIDSAPKEFEVWGLEGENDREPVLIGEYVYDYDGEALQFFAAKVVGSFNMVEMRIKSNHGNPNYTCLYRFRVHGKLDK